MQETVSLPSYFSSIYFKGGLLIAITGVFITNSMINPLMHTINIEYLLSLFKRWFYSRQNSHCSLTQGQANKIYQNPQFPIQSTAASLINVIWFTAFLRPFVYFIWVGLFYSK